MNVAPKADDPALTHDAFLNGRVHAWQPKQGYRAGMDPVLLAAAVVAKPGQSVLELGCGVGVASLCLAHRVGDLHITGIERQPAYADLARRNTAEAGVDASILCADLAGLPPELRQQSFDHVIANPPYFAAGDGTEARDAGREAALREETPLASWMGAAKARLHPKGWLTLIQAADRLPDVLRLLDGFGAVSVRPVSARQGRLAHRVLIQARKGAKAPFRLLAPIYLHAAETHEKDGEDHSEIAAAILRHGQALPWD